MSEEKTAKVCIACGRSTEVTPLIPLEYQGKQYWICAQHFPVLIHDPTRLAGKLPGAEKLQAAEHHD